MCDQIKKRLWIASPYVGSWPAVRSILGTRWRDDADIVIRILTDSSEHASNLNYETMTQFTARRAVRILRGIHAKIYVVDDVAVLTSANLTRTAFVKRHEAGLFLDASESRSLIALFEKWWERESEDVPGDFLLKLAGRSQKTGGEEPSGKALPDRWKLPPDPGGSRTRTAARFGDYASFLDVYRAFARMYERFPRIWPQLPLYLETDGFLDYVFHRAEGTPSKAYRAGRPRPLKDSERAGDIAKYRKLYARSASAEDKKWRTAGWKTVRTLLGRDRIKRLTRADLKRVVAYFNSFNSVAIARKKFLNPKNNSISSIRKAWGDLLYGSDALEARMISCKARLHFFGPSSICEMLGWFDPKRYPIRNANSNAGLRFFGYQLRRLY
jgi:hypothetical protein